MNSDFFPTSMQATANPAHSKTKNSTRLEPRNKTYSIAEGLQARVKDPLWLLGRQWQMGEFRAQNGGQLVRAELNISSRSLNNIVRNKGKEGREVTEPFDQKIPLEMKAEEEKLTPSNRFEAKGWNPKRLEYSFCLKKGDTELISEEYHGNDLDWFNFDVMEIDQISDMTNTIAVKPSPVTFKGMPLARWWSIEDGSVNLGQLKRPSLNFLAMMLLEFSFIYSNDWFVIPVEHKVGNIRRINKCVVMDSFGIVSEVNPVIDKTSNKKDWEVFTLSSKQSNDYSDGRVFYIPNNLYHALESEPVETVSFFRDEMANLVWAIEHRYQDGELVINRHDEDASLEEDSKQVSKVLTPSHYWDTQEKTLVERTLIENEENFGKRFIGPVALYNPMTKPPNHWIPYILYQLDTEGQFMLRRARTTENLTQGPQYKGTILQESKYIFEEEIPRTGIVVNRVFQLARDCNGRRYYWRSRKKKTYEQLKSSGLQFDTLVAPTISI